MGTEEIPHINNVNDTLKMILSEFKLQTQMINEISSKLDMIVNNTSKL